MRRLRSYRRERLPPDLPPDLPPERPPPDLRPAPPLPPDERGEDEPEERPNREDEPREDEVREDREDDPREPEPPEPPEGAELLDVSPNLLRLPPLRAAPPCRAWRSRRAADPLEGDSEREARAERLPRPAASERESKPPPRRGGASDPGANPPPRRRSLRGDVLGRAARAGAAPERLEKVR